MSLLPSFPVILIWAFQGPGDLMICDHCGVLGLEQVRTQFQASIDFKVKEFISEVVRQSGYSTVEQPLPSGICSFYWSSFNWGVGHSIRGKNIQDFSKKRGGNPP